MTDWVIVLVPLLVLPIMLLFRFVGCGFDGVGTREPDIPLPPRTPENPPATTPTPTPPSTPIYVTPPRYRDYIMGEPNNPGTVKNQSVVPSAANVMGYWRLIEAAGIKIAKDEKGLREGQYVEGPTIPNENPTATKAGSDFATGKFTAGQNGLILSEPTALCRDFNGAYALVPVPLTDGLYTDEFTIEAWVLPRPLKLGYEHTLFDAGGLYAIPPAAASDHGFRIFEDRTGHWQMRLAPGTADLFPTPPMVPRPGKTHLAVTVAGEPGSPGKKRVRMYLDGKESATAVANSYSRPDKAPLFIGVENTTPLPSGAIKLRTPALMHIQEVVLHNKALSKEEIENHVDINRN